MRSALTVLGVVICITSIVGMTSLTVASICCRGTSISQYGCNTIIVHKFSGLSFDGGQVCSWK